jgi:hypothetical protein
LYWCEAIYNANRQVHDSPLSIGLINVSGGEQNLRMKNKEKRYKVTGRSVAHYQIIVQALVAYEARHFASYIQLDRGLSLKLVPSGDRK